MHIGEIELLLTLLLKYLLVLGTIVIGEAPFLAPLPVLITRHHDRCVDVGAINLIADDIPIKGVVIFHRLLHILRTLQVVGALVEVVEGQRRGSLHRPARMQQRVRNDLLIDNHVRHIDPCSILLHSAGAVSSVPAIHSRRTALALTVSDGTVLSCRWHSECPQHDYKD